MVLLLSEAGHLSLKELYLDGTKLEANANRYTFVWGKSIKTNKSKIKKQLKELWAYVKKVYQEEEQAPNPPDFDEIDADKVEQTIEKINEVLSRKEVDKKVRQKLNYAKKNWPANLRRYEQQEKELGGRNSMSKTDRDATFMRMKDDQMQNGQLKPGYNLQLSTNNQYIANYTLAQTTADTTTLIDHLRAHQESYAEVPRILTADAGYGSEENYEALEKKGIKAYVKYNYFHKEQREKKSSKIKQPFHANHLHYNQERDRYYCPMGQEMKKVGESNKTTSNGYLQHYSLYQAKNCKGCSLRPTCHQSKENRIIQRNHNLERHKQIAKENLTSEKGIAHRKQRCWDVEAVFGNIKHNMNFKRFMLRGLKKVETEIGLIAIAHNLKKMSLQMGG